jgi:catalase
MHQPLRQICHFFRADPAYGIGVANALGIDIDQFIPKTLKL